MTDEEKWQQLVFILRTILGDSGFFEGEEESPHPERETKLVHELREENRELKEENDVMRAEIKALRRQVGRR